MHVSLGRIPHGLTRSRGHRSALAATLVAAATAAACSDSVAPKRADAVVSIAPRLAGAFASLGGTQTFTATVTDTLGAALAVPATWTITPASATVTVSAAGLVTVGTSAPAGDYVVHATANGASDSATVRVLPRPSGMLVFQSTVNGVAQIFVKDFSNDADAVQITSGTTGVSGGLAVDQTTGVIFFAQGTLPNADIYRINADGSGLTNLTNNVASDNQGPTLNPVTHDVYFTRAAGSANATQVFRMGQDGTGLTQVTTGDQPKVTPAVSPDGRSLSWSELFNGNNLDVVTAAIDGSSPVRFTTATGSDGNSFWTSSARLLWGNASATSTDVLAADVPGGANAANLTNGAGASSQPSAGCASNTVTILRSLNSEMAAYQLDLATQFAVKYALPTKRPISFIRRRC